VNRILFIYCWQSPVASRLLVATGRKATATASLPVDHPVWNDSERPIRELAEPFLPLGRHLAGLSLPRRDSCRHSDSCLLTPAAR
jgi:hypothetical protein